MKTALVCGAGGFIGGHLVERLKREGYWVLGVDVKEPEFRKTAADRFFTNDLRDNMSARYSFAVRDIDEVYQLAADMGGMGYIHSAACDIMHHNALINANVLDAAAKAGVKRYFFSSSVCVYPDMAIGAPEMDEDGVYPAMPDNEYGWEKLYAERMALAYGRKYGMAVRIARFQNCYGPYGTWQGGREKAPAAMCRKVAEVPDGGSVEVWGDGRAVRNYIYVDDLVDGIYRLMHSDETRPTNIGTDEYVTVDELVHTVARVAGKRVNIQHVEGPVGVRSRNFSNARMRALGWEPRYTLEQGIAETYPWVAGQVAAQ
jgi:GDP-D-mannose 3',5'-epimerase